MRQAFAGMLWSKQLFYYDVTRWLDGDPAQPVPPRERLTGRNSRWRNFDAFDIMSMPDKWEYPWFAAWDLAFHCVALAHVDPAFAKYQLILLCREWFEHPNGALPAYEWDFGDVNPPVQAWAALEVFAIDGGRDLDFLSAGSSTSCWSTSPGGSTGRTPRATTCSRAASSAWTTSARSTARTCRRAGPGAVRRHRLDGLLRHRDGRHGRHPEPVRPAARRGSRPEVPRALRRHHRGAGRARPVGRDRRAVLRPAQDAGRRGGPGEGPVDGGHHPRPGRRGRSPRTTSSGSLTVGKQFAGLPGPARPASTGTSSAEIGLLRGEPGQQRLLLSLCGVDRLQRLFAKAFDESEFLSPLRPAGPVGLSPRASLHARGTTASRRASTTSRPSPPRPCSAATPTGAARSGSR